MSACWDDARVPTVRVRIGTRGSPLALAQTTLVADALRAAHPDLSVSPVRITTAGDRTQHTDLPMEGWGQGVFVKDIEAALLRGEVDLAVHSLKDLPPELADGLVIAAVPERADPRDVLVTRDGCSLDDLPWGAAVGTSSARRAALLRAIRPDPRYVPIRGNVDTRVRKLLAGAYDAIILAAAGLDRLGLDVPRVALDPAVLLPAPGQGALGLQSRRGDEATAALVRPLHHAPTAAAVAAERRVMALLDGGCRLPVAALAGAVPPPARAEWTGDTLLLQAAVAAADGSRVLRDEALGPADAPERLAEALAARLRGAGAGTLAAAHQAEVGAAFSVST